MQVLPFFKKVQVRLISHEQLVTAITHADRCGVNLVTVAEMDAVEITAYQHRH